VYPAIAQHALTDTAPRDGLHRAAALSDGATRLVDRFGLLDWPRFLEILAEQGPDAIIAQVRAAERSDPDGQRWPRGKRHDDASAAFCHLFRVAVSGRREQEASFFTVVVWRDHADHAAQSLTKGSRVVVVGRLQQRTWTAEDGSVRSTVKVVAEELGASLRWATATTARAIKSGGE
jgi:hypothetical protein